MEKTAFNWVELLKNFSRTGQHADKFNENNDPPLGTFTNDVALSRDYLNWLTYLATPQDTSRIKDFRSGMGLFQLYPNVTNWGLHSLDAVAGTDFDIGTGTAGIDYGDADKTKRTLPNFLRSKIYDFGKTGDAWIQKRINVYLNRHLNNYIGRPVGTFAHKWLINPLYNKIGEPLQKGINNYLINPIHDKIERLAGFDVVRDPNGKLLIRTPEKPVNMTGRGINKLHNNATGGNARYARKMNRIIFDLPAKNSIENGITTPVKTYTVQEVKEPLIRTAVRNKIVNKLNEGYNGIKTRIAPSIYRTAAKHPYATEGLRRLGDITNTGFRRLGALATNPITGRVLGTVGGTFQLKDGYTDMLDNSKNWVDRTEGGIRGTLGGATMLTSALGGATVAAPLITADLAYQGTNYLNNKFGKPYADKQMNKRMDKYKNPDGSYNVPGFWGQVGMGAQYMGDEIKGIIGGGASAAYNSVAKNSWMPWNWWSKSSEYLIPQARIKQAQFQRACRYVLRMRSCNS